MRPTGACVSWVDVLAIALAAPFLIVAIRPPVMDVREAVVRPQYEPAVRDLLTVETATCQLAFLEPAPVPIARWQCGPDATVEAHVRRDHGTETASWHFPGLAIELHGSVLPELGAALGPRLAKLGNSELWNDVPLPLHASSRLEALMAALLIFSSVRVLRLSAGNGRPSVVLLLLVLGFATRAIVRAAPMNNYSDLLTPFESFRNDWSYRVAAYDVLYLFGGGPESLFAANIVLGALTAPVLYLALQGDHRAGAAVVPFAAAVAVLPFYARLSASDSPHVWAGFVLSLGLLHASRALDGHPVAWIGTALAAALVGATRMELATAPLMALLLVPLHSRTAEPRDWLRCVTAIALGISYAVFLSNLQLAGHPNFHPDLSFTTFARGAWDFLIGLPFVLLMRVGHLPWLLTAGSAFLIIEWIRRREWRLLGFFVGGTALLGVHTIASAPFFSNLSGLVPYWSQARYSALWLLVPLFFSAWGVRDLAVATFGSVKGARPLAAKVGIAVAALALIASAIPDFFSEVPYQAEYRFLRQFLQDHHGAGIAAGWRKNAGSDFCASLSLPYFGLDGYAPRLYVSDGSSSEAFLEAVPDDTLFFVNAIGQIAGTTSHLAEPLAIRHAAAEFRRLTCLVRHAGERVAFEHARGLEYVQWDFDGGDAVDLELWRIDKSKLPAAERECATIDAEEAKIRM